MRCKCGCGREVQANEKGRPGEYYSGACRVRMHRRSDVTKVSEEVTKCVVPPFTEVQSELLSIGERISYQHILLGSSWGGVRIQPGLVGWTQYATSEKERLPVVVAGLRKYVGHLIDAGLADGHVTKVTNECCGGLNFFPRTTSAH